ncbi:membrane-anchored glycerophosphoryl diester phosphodiesterase (GDPDase) [Alkalibacillus flavidus]|uniref:Membrane-anchored glycerophosphoryl diester phosphodiesterase (GDPDase) n=1 Tax=Alkalibacillus flavidus TaxID=546021 RepID=A0ABV2KXJ7_9BACI
MPTKRYLLLYIIIGLAVIGLLGQLIVNPLSFVESMLTTIGLAVVIGGILYFVLKRFRFGSKTSSAYRKAVKQSKKKYGNVDKNMGYNQHINKPTPIKKQRRQSHLTVIKGNKK